MPGKSQVIDRTGHRYGRWTVKFRVKNKNGRAQWLCQCDCGTRRVVQGSALSKSKSCGCLTAERAREPKRQEQSDSESWTADRAGWAVSEFQLRMIRERIRPEASP